MIKTIRIAYKIGFSSALNPDTISAYAEMARWIFVEDALIERRQHRTFCRGYESGLKILKEVRNSQKQPT